MSKAIGASEAGQLSQPVEEKQFPHFLDARLVRLLLVCVILSPSYSKYLVGHIELIIWDIADVCLLDIFFHLIWAILVWKIMETATGRFFSQFGTNF